MHRTYVYKLKPTARQVEGLDRYLRVTRAIYNAALEQRRDVYSRTGATRSWIDQSLEIKDLYAAGLLEGCSVKPVQHTLKRLDLAYEAFFRRCGTTAKAKGFPRFKGHRHWRSIHFKEHGNGCRFDAGTQRLRVLGVGSIRVRLHRPTAGIVKRVILVLKPDGWYAYVVCDVGAAPARVVGEAVGLDVGIATLATLSTGERVTNPRHLRAAERKLLTEQRSMSRKRRGSRRRDKQRQRVALAYLHVARCRRDFHHKTAHALAERYTTIVVEDLAVTNMVRSARGTVENPGRRVAQKAGLNRGIQDAGWAQLTTLLGEKLEARGGVLIRVDPRRTSQTCAECGTVDAASRRTQAVFCCTACGHTAHADHNAARNILNRAGAVPVVEAA
jgi:putative transposase